MINLRFIITLIIFTLPSTCFSETENPGVMPSIELLNFATGKKEVLENPLTLTVEEARKYLPQLESAKVTFNQFIASGFLPLESVFYTYYDLVGMEFEPIPPNKFK